MKRMVMINGKICDNLEQAKISVYDRSFLFGDSIYEVVRSYNRGFFLIDEHIDRLWRSAELMRMELNFSKQQLKNEIIDIAKSFDEDNIYVRIVVSRGEVEEINVNPLVTTTQALRVIYVNPINDIPEVWKTSGVSYMTSSYQRVSKKAVDPAIKSGNYLNSVLAVHEAKLAGYNDALLYNENGYLTEGTTNNVWAVKDGVVYSPSNDCGILYGITRDILFKLMKDNNIEFEEKEITKTEVMNSDEMFFTSSTKEVVPITRVDDTSIGEGRPGPLTQRLMGILNTYVLDLTSNNKSY